MKKLFKKHPFLSGIFYMPMLLFILNGCSQCTLSPRKPFECVNNEIQSKIGKGICWNSDGDVACEIQAMLQRPLSNDDAIRIALLNNRHLQAIYEELGIAQSELVQAGLLKNPIFDFSYRWALNQTPGYKIETGIAQDFLDIFLIPLKKRAAIENLEQVKLLIIEEVLQVAAHTQIEYYTLQAAIERQSLYETLSTIAELAYEFEKTIEEAGNTDTLILTRFHIEAEHAKLEEQKTELAVIESKEKLNVLMGLWGCNIEWTPITPLPEIEKELCRPSCIENIAVSANLELKMLFHEFKQTAAENRIEVTETVIPELASGPITEKEVEGQWNLGPGIAIGLPLFDFGIAKSAKGNAKLRLIQKNMIAHAINIRAEARKMQHELSNAHATAHIALESLYPLSESEMSETELLYNAMQLGTPELLESKKKVSNAKLLRVEMLHNYWVSKTKLEYLLKGVLYENR